jgi:hypothetical protein
MISIIESIFTETQAQTEEEIKGMLKKENFKSYLKNVLGAWCSWWWFSRSWESLIQSV